MGRGRKSNMDASCIAARRQKLARFQTALTTCLVFFCVGVSLPYIPLWYREFRHLSGEQIAILAAAPTLFRVVTGPVLTLGANGFRDSRLPLACAILGASAFWFLYPFAPGFSGLLVTVFVAQTLFSIATPLVEAELIRVSRPHTGSPLANSGAADPHIYGVLRAYGSGAFIVGNLLGGVLTRYYGASVVLILMISSAFFASVSALSLPAPSHSATSQGADPASRIGFRARLRDAFDLLGRREILIVLLVAGFIQSAHAFYYGFSSLVWKDQGFSETQIGNLWAIAVTAEVIFLALSGRMMNKISARDLIIIGGLLAILRWIGLGFAPGFGVSLVLQILHCGSFAMVHVGTIRFLSDHVREDQLPLSQSLVSALGGGLFIGLLSLLSGPLYEHFANQAYFAMSVVALIGVICAAYGMVGSQTARHDPRNPH